MNIERELSLTCFSKYLEANPDKLEELAVKYYAKCLQQQDQIRNLAENCNDLERAYKELEREKEDIYADYELLRAELEQEQKKNIALRSSSNRQSNRQIVLPDFLPLNPHHFL